VGAVDAIVDIVGTSLGLDWLGLINLLLGATDWGGGTAAHGVLPVPVPAVLKLWEMRGCPVYSNGIAGTGDANWGCDRNHLATDFGSPPAMTLQRVGLERVPDLPIPTSCDLGGEVRDQGSTVILMMPSPSLETISVLETQIDDLNPQAIGYVFEALFAVGAVDVFTRQLE